MIDRTFASPDKWAEQVASLVSSSEVFGDAVKALTESVFDDIDLSVRELAVTCFNKVKSEMGTASLSASIEDANSITFETMFISTIWREIFNRLLTNLERNY